MDLCLEHSRVPTPRVWPRKRHLALIFLIGAAALQATIEWDTVQRVARSAYAFIEAIATNKMIYSESRVESLLMPLRKEIAALKVTANRASCTCASSLPHANGESRPPYESRYSIDPPIKR
jgi:hypothetical protein